MSQPSKFRVGPAAKCRAGRRGSARTLALAAVCLAVGLGGGAYWFGQRTARSDTPAPSPRLAEAPRALSAGTKELLGRLDGPVAVRYYALLDPASTSAGLRQYAERVSQLLAAYAEASGGKLTVSRSLSRSDAAEAAALADGLRAFNLDRGDACYLGLVLQRQDRKETIQLAPEWETALEADLSRALARVLTPAPVAGAAKAAAPQADRAAIEEVKLAIPNIAAVSLEEGTQMLRTKALVEFAAIAQEMETQLKQAEQRFTQAQTEAERQTARNELQRIRNEQTEKLKTVALRLQAQLEALGQMKQK